jgi:hypothetical protein
MDVYLSYVVGKKPGSVVRIRVPGDDNCVWSVVGMDCPLAVLDLGPVDQRGTALAPNVFFVCVFIAVVGIRFLLAFSCAAVEYGIFLSIA